MISIIDGYNRMKELTDYPLDSLFENDKFIVGANSKIFILNKESEEIDVELEWLAISLDITNLIPVYLQELFDDYLVYYRIHNDEMSLAEQYATAWEHVYWNSINEKDEEVSVGDFEKITAKWVQIEKGVYKDIRDIMDNENIDYPPCVSDKMDDPFYSIKPFMLKNGYTVAIRDKIWVKT